MKPIYLEKSLGIDIREESVSITLLGKQFRKINVLGYHFFKISPLGEKNDKAEKEFLNEINQFLIKHDTVWDHTVISFPSRLITLKTFTLPAPDRKSVDSMIEYELERHFAKGTEDLYYSFQAKEKIENQFYIILFSIKKDTFHYYFKLLQRVNIKPTIIEISTLSNLKSLGPKASLDKKVIAMLDLSSNSVETSIFKEGEIECSRSTPIDIPRYQEFFFQKDVSQEDLEGVSNDLSHTLIEEIQNGLAGSPNVEDDELLDHLYLFGGGPITTCLAQYLENKTEVPSSVVFSQLEYNLDIPRDFSTSHLDTAFGNSLRELKNSKTSINLLPKNLRPKRKKFNIRTTLALAAGIILLSLGVLAAKIIHNNLTLNSLEAQLERVKIKVGALEKIDIQFDNLKKYITIFGVIDQKTPLKLPLIQELSRILPKDTWLTDIVILKNKIEIKGFSASAAKLIALIENSNYFKDTVFNGSVVRQDEGDKFTIRATLEKRPL